MSSLPMTRPRTALEWKRFYAAERTALGVEGLLRLVDEAPECELPPGGALVFPHTRLAHSGTLIAAAAKAVVASGAGTVLALGALHGGRESDAALVAAARAGDPGAVRALRRVHGPGAADDDGVWAEEFSLANFLVLLRVAAWRMAQPAPRVITRYPYLTGTDPASLPGFDELQRLRAEGAALVATADVIHHGVGYDTPASELRERTAPDTLAWASHRIVAHHTLAARGAFAEFQLDAGRLRSDFRHAGPVLGALVCGTPSLCALELVSYADVFGCAEPTWVAAGLVAYSA